MLLGTICSPGELVGCHGEHLLGILLMMQAQPSQLGLCESPGSRKLGLFGLNLNQLLSTGGGFLSCYWVAPCGRGTKEQLAGDFTLGFFGFFLEEEGRVKAGLVMQLF